MRRPLGPTVEVIVLLAVTVAFLLFMSASSDAVVRSADAEGVCLPPNTTFPHQGVIRIHFHGTSGYVNPFSILIDGAYPAQPADQNIPIEPKSVDEIWPYRSGKHKLVIAQAHWVFVATVVIPPCP